MMGDERLIQAVAAGDGEALRELFDRHAPWVAARLRRAMPAHAVEDALQETFIAVWREAKGYPRADFATLLAACVAGVSTYSPFGEVERVSSFPLSALRFWHLAGLLACAALAFLIVALLWGQDFAALLFRTLPFAFVAIIPLVGDGTGERKWAWWAWVDRPAGDSRSWTLAAGTPSSC